MTLPVVALDVGGTSVKSGLVSPADHEVREWRDDPLDSLAPADGIVESLMTIVRRAIAAAPASAVAGIGLGFPGPMDYSKGICLIQGGSAAAPAPPALPAPTAPSRAAGRAEQAGISHAGGRAKFESLYGLDLRATFQARLGLPDLPIAFGNDATVALLGEARYGSGRGYRRLIGLTLGTGLGSAFLVDGQTVEAGAGVPPQGWLYSQPYRNHPADDSFSARGLRQRWQLAGASYADVKAAAGGARAGDWPARRVFAAFGAELGEFLRPYSQPFAAEAVLILGGLAGAFDLFEPSLTNTLGLPVQRGVLGPRAALFGAADLLFDRPGSGMVRGAKLL